MRLKHILRFDGKLLKEKREECLSFILDNISLLNASIQGFCIDQRHIVIFLVASFSNLIPQTKRLCPYKSLSKDVVPSAT